MKIAGFNALCHREHEQGRGTVVALYLTDESYAELLAEVLSEPVQVTVEPPLPDGIQCGARLDAMTNPETRTPVSIGRAIPRALFADTAEVTRWVPVRQPIPPCPCGSAHPEGYTCTQQAAGT